MPSLMPPRRKKWTEEEERTLIDKYGEMISDGTLAKMKTREKKFRPIATHVNMMHHGRGPISFPWQWSWKDVSTKVQNMRHQYLLVKQKIKKPGVGDSCGPEDFVWVEGLTHWPNFLRYKDVFGDVALGSNDPIMTNTNSNSMTVNRNSNGRSHAKRIGVMDPSPETGFGVGFDGMENGVLGLGFEYEGEEGDGNDGNHDNNNNNNVKGDGDEGFGYEEMETEMLIESVRMKKKSKLKAVEKLAWPSLVNQLGQLREREARLENQEAERERKRQRREQYRSELEEERERNLEELEKEREQVRENLRREQEREWQEMEKESLERECQRKEEELIKEREWEERMDRRRLEWRKRMDDMLSQHRMAVDQLHSRMIHDQQSVVNQLLGIVTQWTEHPAGLSDHTNPYLSQMMQNLHHVNGIVHGENRVGGDGHEDQFIVDG